MLILVGTDVREFLLDGGGANGSNKIIGVDLEQDFLDLGQALFKGPTPGIEFRAANLIDSPETRLDDIKGKVTLLYTGAVFHLFQEEDQRKFAENIYTLLAKEGEVVVFGMHVGAKVKGLKMSRSGGVTYAHDPQSWKELWTEVLGEDPKNWTMRAELRNSWTEAEYVNEEHQILQWSLWRK
jgi:Methyltransferase domain